MWYIDFFMFHKGLPVNKVLTKKALLDLIGYELGCSDWLIVDQSMIDQFAQVTKDHQFIHVDPQKASLTPFGTTIAHGFLTLSLLSHLAEIGFGFTLEGSKFGLNYGFDKIRFISPVKVGSKIRARAKLVSVTERGQGSLIIKQSVVVEVKGTDKAALTADLLIMYVS